MTCYRCNGALRYDREAPYCVMCGRFQYPEKIREWNEQALKKAEKAAPVVKDVRSVEEIKAEQENEGKPKQVWHRGADLHDVGRPLSLSRAEKQYGREHYISARPAPRNRIGEGR